MCMSDQIPGKRSAFTLIEIVVIVGILGMIILIVVPMMVVGHKRSKAEIVMSDLKTLNKAIHQYAVETGRSSGFAPTYKDIRKYLDKNSNVYRSDGKDLCGNAYGPFSVDIPPKVPEQTYDYFSSVVDDAYWSIYR